MKFDIIWHHSLHSCHLDCVRLTYPAPLRFGRGRAAVASEVTGTGARGPGLILLQILEELITAPLLKSLCALCQLAVIDLKATSLISIHIWIYAYVSSYLLCVREKTSHSTSEEFNKEMCSYLTFSLLLFFFFYLHSVQGWPQGHGCPIKAHPWGLLDLHMEEHRQFGQGCLTQP